MAMVSAQSLRKSTIITSRGNSSIKERYEADRHEIQKDFVQLFERKDPQDLRQQYEQWQKPHLEQLDWAQAHCQPRKWDFENNTS